MPGSHIDIKIMRCFDDVGGCDAWMGGLWFQHGQWWVGWHQRGAFGLDGLLGWSYPNENQAWHLIGFELWGHYKKGGERLIEAYYHFPNPSTMKNPPPPNGHWHMIWHPNGSLMSSTRQEYRKDTLAQIDEYVDTMGGGKGKAFGKGQQAFEKGQLAFGKGYSFGQGKSKGEGSFENESKGKGKGKARARRRQRVRAKGRRAA